MLLDKDYQHLKITDFGLNKVGVVENGECSFEYTSDSGTPGYCAPEILKDVKAFTTKVDVFALGRTCWRLMYRAHVMNEIIVYKSMIDPKKIFKQQYPSPTKFVITCKKHKLLE